MFTLACLTVSLPFAYAAKQIVERNYSMDVNMPYAGSEDETDNTFADTTEEKTSGNFSSSSEEYLHDSHSSDQYFAVPSTEYKVEQFSTYIAFYGELISPPPDIF
jgi:hypothetical protein